MTTSFSNKKELRFIITLATGTFGSSSNNQITLEGYRAVADIDRAGGQMMGTLKAQIYGVSQSDMNSITTLQWQAGYLININTVQVYAIDGTQQTLVFSGNIVNAWGDYRSQPDVFLMIQAQAAYINQLQAAAPRSYNGPVSVATIMQQLATSMGMTFENNGVTTQLSNQYLGNTSLEQAKTLARAAGIDMYVDSSSNPAVLAITPKYTARNKPVPQITSDSGLLGYPTFDGIGVNFQMLFNPSVVFGGSIQMTSDLPQANGTWIVVGLAYKLESEKPNGAWFQTVRGNKNGFAVTN